MLPVLSAIRPMSMKPQPPTGVIIKSEEALLVSWPNERSDNEKSAGILDRRFVLRDVRHREVDRLRHRDYALHESGAGACEEDFRVEVIRPLP